MCIITNRADGMCSITDCTDDMCSTTECSDNSWSFRYSLTRYDRKNISNELRDKHVTKAFLPIHRVIVGALNVHFSFVLLLNSCYCIWYTATE